MQQEIYLIKEDNFWHSQLTQLNPLTIQIRAGKLVAGVEQPETLKKHLKQFRSMQQGVDELSDLIQLKF
jgi:DNA ligase-1